MQNKTPSILLVQVDILARKALAGDREALCQAVQLLETVVNFSLEGFGEDGTIEDAATCLIRCVREFSGWKFGAEPLPEEIREQRLDREEARWLETEGVKRDRVRCPHCQAYVGGKRAAECLSCEERHVGALKAAAKRYVEIMQSEQSGIETHAVSTFCDVVAYALDEARTWGGALPSGQAADTGLAKGMADWDAICAEYSSGSSDEPEDAETQAWLNDLDRKAWRHMRDIAKLVIDAIEAEDDLSFSVLCRLVAAGVRGWADGDHVPLGMGNPPENDGAAFLAWSDRYRAKRERVVGECIEAAIADAAKRG